MKINLRDRMSRRAIKSVSRVAIAFLALGIAAGPSMFAKPKEKKSAVSNLGVIAHVQLDGGSATHMVLMEKNGRTLSSPPISLFPFIVLTAVARPHVN